MFHILARKQSAISEIYDKNAHARYASIWNSSYYKIYVHVYNFNILSRHSFRFFKMANAITN